jgi:protein-S-isoprenylcysteine O-methyltransferase Ste14
VIYIVLSAIGFGFLFLFEVVSINNLPAFKPIIFLISNGLLIPSVILMALSPNKVIFPVWTFSLGWILLPPAVFLKIYSLLIGLPFRKTYISKEVSHTLITTGIYSLVRYPWLGSFLLMLLALILVSGSRLLMIATPILIGMNLILAILQDRFFYIRMFTGYAGYRRQTPMLIPNRQSLKAFMRSIRSEMRTFNFGKNKQ